MESIKSLCDRMGLSYEQETSTVIKVLYGTSEWHVQKALFEEVLRLMNYAFESVSVDHTLIDLSEQDELHIVANSPVLLQRTATRWYCFRGDYALLKQYLDTLELRFLAFNDYNSMGDAIKVITLYVDE